MLVDKEFYILARDAFWDEMCERETYMRRLALHGRKEDLEHFLNKGYLSRLSEPEKEGSYDEICCCVLRHKKMSREMRDYLLSSDIYLAPSCDRCEDRKGYGLVENITFLLNRIRN
ncbi:Hypothetical protein BRZCDTV_399 [Brazilian cedratvirus IHUMI]|uniref:Uncharacterized protein n=1 Tax=Brazilian cedratvirus IHUMI TaxID=2126980 RepID=A0A2R8FET4_9VIRU|nr:Hypothetical protein BRZCDTV_399 [Brazilian cedratvirus IHUMI]